MWWFLGWVMTGGRPDIVWLDQLRPNPEFDGMD